MAEDSAQEKTEEATSRKLEKARDEGQVPRSKELITTSVLLAGTLGLLVFGGHLSREISSVMAYNFSISRETVFDTNMMLAHLGVSMSRAILALAPIFLVLVIAAIAGPIGLGGWLMSAKSLAPKFSRIDPISGLKRMFSLKSLVELVKSIGKIAVVMATAYMILATIKAPLLRLSQEPVELGMRHGLQMCLIAAIILSVSTLLIVLIDVPFQVWDHAKKMRMSRQEVKDEMKETEGKPEVKGKIRQLQQEIAQRRMMESVPEADVVITNPSHYSVALKYNPDKMETPLLLAKGIDHVALKIREIAKLNGIDFIESPVLARAIYHTTELDQEIPQGLYMAVAQVLAYVFQLREYRKGKGDKPRYPGRLNIPEDMRHY